MPRSLNAIAANAEPLCEMNVTGPCRTSSGVANPVARRWWVSLQEAHPVAAAQRDARLAGDRARVARSAAGSRIRLVFVQGRERDRRTRARRDRVDERLLDTGVGYAQDREIGSLG